MTRKRKRNKNPLLEKKWMEGYERGKQDGISQAVNFFTAKFNGLEDVPGIGKKTMDKIKSQLGDEYFG